MDAASLLQSSLNPSLSLSSLQQLAALPQPQAVQLPNGSILWTSALQQQLQQQTPAQQAAPPAVLLSSQPQSKPNPALNNPTSLISLPPLAQLTQAVLNNAQPNGGQLPFFNLSNTNTHVNNDQTQSLHTLNLQSLLFPNTGNGALSLPIPQPSQSQPQSVLAQLQTSLLQAAQQGSLHALQQYHGLQQLLAAQQQPQQSQQQSILSQLPPHPPQSSSPPSSALLPLPPFQVNGNMLNGGGHASGSESSPGPGYNSNGNGHHYSSNHRSQSTSFANDTESNSSGSGSGGNDRNSHDSNKVSHSNIASNITSESSRSSQSQSAFKHRKRDREELDGHKLHSNSRSRDGKVSRISPFRQELRDVVAVRERERISGGGSSSSSNNSGSGSGNNSSTSSDSGPSGGSETGSGSDEDRRTDADDERDNENRNDKQQARKKHQTHSSAQLKREISNANAHTGNSVPSGLSSLTGLASSMFLSDDVLLPKDGAPFNLTYPQSSSSGLRPSSSTLLANASALLAANNNQQQSQQHAVTPLAFLNLANNNNLNTINVNSNQSQSQSQTSQQQQLLKLSQYLNQLQSSLTDKPHPPVVAVQTLLQHLQLQQQQQQQQKHSAQGLASNTPSNMLPPSPAQITTQLAGSPPRAFTNNGYDINSQTTSGISEGQISSNNEDLTQLLNRSFSQSMPLSSASSGAGGNSNSHNVTVTSGGKKMRKKHIVTDRARRAKIKDGMEQLRSLLSVHGSFTTDQVSIMLASVQLIKKLRSEVSVLKQHSTTLKGELEKYKNKFGPLNLIDGSASTTGGSSSGSDGNDSINSGLAQARSQLNAMSTLASLRLDSSTLSSLNLDALNSLNSLALLSSLAPTNHSTGSNNNNGSQLSVPSTSAFSSPSDCGSSKSPSPLQVPMAALSMDSVYGKMETDSSTPSNCNSDESNGNDDSPLPPDNCDRTSSDEKPAGENGQIDCNSIGGSADSNDTVADGSARCDDSTMSISPV